ncbi:MAG TPA: WhiB family transcriptional regulator [Mycobacteriales bacterium]|nr:WhiB family transcriptional regulator [Mycobacteriales bacterium]
MSSDNGSPATPAVAQVFSGLDVDDAREVWESALCAQVDPEVFFPEMGQPTVVAKAVCAACPVTALCLATFGPLVTHGVVGGRSADERTRARRAERRERERRAA